MKTLANKTPAQDVLDSLFVLILFSSLYLGAKFTLNLGVKITPTDIVILIFLFLTAIRKQFVFKLGIYKALLCSAKPLARHISQQRAGKE